LKCKANSQIRAIVDMKMNCVKDLDGKIVIESEEIKED